MPAGYSKRTLAEKLGLKPGMHAAAIHAPAGYAAMLGETSMWLGGTSPPYDFLHVFVLDASVLEENLQSWKRMIAMPGMLWISWPKRSSGVNTDLDEKAVRGAGLRIGLVDVKVCSVDEIWSGLKFVYRKMDRDLSRVSAS